MVMYTGLARVARGAGLTVRETSGWKSRTAHRGGMVGARGVLWHHTATSAAAVKSRNNPTLNYMISGLGYPLCNFAMAWDGSIDVVAAGTGAHAGKGKYGSRIPRDQGNQYLIGIEVEGTIGLTWSDAQLESAARLGRALAKEWGSGFLQIGHNEYAPGRKTDPTGIPGGMPALRKAIKRGYWKDKNWKPGGKVSTGSSGGSAGSSKSSSKAWPHKKVKVTSKHTTASHRAYVKMLAGVGFKDKSLTTAIQKWLRWNGYYKASDGFIVDGDMGRLTVQELQKFLKAKGFYKGVIDGSRGPMTIRGEIRYINDQAKHYK